MMYRRRSPFEVSEADQAASGAPSAGLPNRQRLAMPAGGGGELPLPERFDDPTFASQIHSYKTAKDFMWA